jgi:hypothetical protein
MGKSRMLRVLIGRKRAEKGRDGRSKCHAISALRRRSASPPAGGMPIANLLAPYDSSRVDRHARPPGGICRPHAGGARHTTPSSNRRNLPMKRVFLFALFFSLALVGCADDAAPEEGDDVSAEQTKTADVEVAAKKVPFCLPGEKVVCTLGPPPVCHCE